MTTTLRPSPVAACNTIESALTVRVVRAESTRTVVALRGEADASTTATVSDALSRVIASHAGDVVVDLSQLQFIDSATVRILATTQELLLRRGRRLVVRSPSRLAFFILDVFGLTELVEAADAGPQAA